jgi:hypothetical protein
MTSKDRYVVVKNVPGYLSMDDDPATFSNRKDAERYAADLATMAVDSYWEVDRPVRKSGNARTGYYIVDPTDPYDLGIVVEVLPLA